MTVGKDFPLLINATKQVLISSADFKKLSYIGLSSLMCLYPVVISKSKKGMVINISESNASKLGEFDDGNLLHPRFEGTRWTINREAELVMGAIPTGHPLIKTIEKYYSHLIMK